MDKNTKEIEVELDNDTFIRLALEAHNRNITFNALCNELLSKYVDEQKKKK